ncbi:hypothetical protein TNCT_664101 [Trichonephila clavata]|uniref:HAT C-terminal dimerisation domain-containing protein n=1 Tax=Trichonephila clavata TaxID=2740835 RepID=A0A8X6HEW3_TRICU|nr:hypothetical protein TNCT_664101 [Trichonephila clavata]
MSLFQNPFVADMASCPDEQKLRPLSCKQMMSLERSSRKDWWVLTKKDYFQMSKVFASKFLSNFGITYLCEQTFSRMKYVNENLNTSLSDDYLR